MLAAIDEAGIEQLWCLGDVVGYGAQPDECAALVRSAASSAWSATTTWRCSGELDTDVFSAAAAAAVEWTRANADAGDDRVPAGAEARERRARGRPLPRLPARPGLGVRPGRRPGRRVHRGAGRAGQPDRPLARRALLLRRRRPARRATAAARPRTAGRSTSPRAAGCSTPGSVGQPRDGDPRAAWLELDTDGWQATYHRVTYDIDRAAEAIGGPDCPSCSPTGSTWASDVGRFHQRGVSSVTASLAAMPNKLRPIVLALLPGDRRRGRPGLRREQRSRPVDPRRRRRGSDSQDRRDPGERPGRQLPGRSVQDRRPARRHQQSAQRASTRASGTLWSAARTT